MRFTKMEGLGNDYIYVDCFKEELNIADAPALSVKLSDRHFGIGADGLILILPSEKADCRMRIFNADGSEAEMCGNGIRCVGKLFYELGYVGKRELEEAISVETGAGIKYVKLCFEDGCVTDATVDMGAPEYGPDGGLRAIETDGRVWETTCVSMGNPHCVIFLEGEEAGSIENMDLAEAGPKFENHKAFPNRTNTEFVSRLPDGSLRMRVWERGSGETMACGTGACAVAVAAVLRGFADANSEITVHLNGGDLFITWDRVNARVYMKGPARTVFEGQV